ncbi:Ribulose bisphosphate carboxylase/oxygenase activase [Melia azedarach]|uniref:Ribulose bisphosphate carboxylase/oxygenase activase n=1 Tax=Melia azedarach TaxID=155640 RepID=A0ACC1WZH8_MELAZ|nr:Ribulose bisphosphate carboxylase/oxygenase activase [Melia azedarach]
MESEISSDSRGLLSAKKRVSLVQLKTHGSSTGTSVPSSALLGKSLKKVSSKISRQRLSSNKFKVVSEYDEKKQTAADRWGGLAYDTSDDQKDITRGKGVVDSLFQTPMGMCY